MTKTFGLALAASILGALIGIPQAAFALSGPTACGGFRTQGYGPYDYRTHKDKLPIVEGYHFTPEVEMLVRGKSSTDIGEDINYTLDVFPNHHRALVSMMRLAERMKTTQPPGARFTIDCYFDRALRYAPTDVVARLLYADYLVKNGRTAEAQTQLDRVTTLAEDNAFTHYNLGLLYLEMKNYEKAQAEAMVAQSLGLPKTELIDSLKRAGKWRNDATGSADAASASPSNSGAAAQPAPPASEDVARP